MLVENTREETLKAFLDGNKKTMVAVRMEDGRMRFVHLTTLLPADGVYFIDVELEPGEDHGEMLLRNHQGGVRNGDLSSRSGSWQRQGNEKRRCREGEAQEKDGRGYH